MIFSVIDGEARLTPEASRHTGQRTRQGQAGSTLPRRLSKRELERGRMLYPDLDVMRPQTRGDCLHGPMAGRPCPFVSCEYHLYLDVNEHTGSIKLNFPDREVGEMPETCSLDVADRGGLTLEEVGAIMNLTRERIRQIEIRALARLGMAAIADSLDAYLEAP
ncbi:MAG: DNA-binding protein [Myxococcales bacterium]|nr:DNA-binding protein [Myxococcales bacterium]